MTRLLCHAVSRKGVHVTLLALVAVFTVAFTPRELYTVRGILDHPVRHCLQRASLSFAAAGSRFAPTGERLCDAASAPRAVETRNWAAAFFNSGGKLLFSGNPVSALATA